MLSVGIKVPIYRTRKQRPELAQAEAEKLRAGSELQVQSQQVASELRAQYVIVQQTSELLRIHREGLSPQARSAFQAGLAAYQSNKQEFQALLTAFLDVLHLDEDYWQNVAEYETAVGRLEQLTGLSLREEGAKR
jgi:outer membrane protein TolC